MTDLNTLVPDDAPLYLLTAFAINDAGEIAGFGVQKDASNQVHGFLAIPIIPGAQDAESRLHSERRAIGPMALENARKVLFRQAFVAAAK
jgi:hypothetical protein